MQNMFLTNFRWIDWGIVGVYLAGVVTIGIIVNKYIHNVTDYMVAGRRTGTSLNVTSYIATGLGLVSVMYISIDGFTRSFSYLIIGVLTFAICILIGVSGFVIYRLREMKLVTIPEFFEKRYNNKLRVTSGVMCVLAGVLNMGLFPRMGATFIAYVTGLSNTPDQAYMVNLITTILIVLALVYTVMGGMVAVIVTDFIQFIILSIGMGVGLYFCLTHPSLSWDQLVSTLAQQRGEAAFNPFHPDSYGYTYMIWMVIVFTFGYVVWGPETSRALTAKDPKTAKRTFLLSSLKSAFVFGVPTIWGIAAYCYFQQQPELSGHFFPNGPGGEAANVAAAMPLLIGKIVPPVLIGLLVAGLMGAFMSTHDSYLLCWSSVISRDIISPLKGQMLSDKQQIRVTRISIVVIGAFLFIWGIWYELPKSVWTYMAITANIYIAGAGIALVGGMYWKRASSAGAFASIACGGFSICGIFLEPIQRIIPQISMPILGIGTYVLCAIVFIVFSLLFPDSKEVAMKERV